MIPVFNIPAKEEAISKLLSPQITMWKIELRVRYSLTLHTSEEKMGAVF